MLQSFKENFEIPKQISFSFKVVFIFYCQEFKGFCHFICLSLNNLD